MTLIININRMNRRRNDNRSVGSRIMYKFEEEI
jgi:hypothetical protein